MISRTEEDYLKTIFYLEQKNGIAGVKDIATILDIKMPTVNNMVKRLHEKKLLHYEAYQPIHLTPKGQRTALLIIRKHRLVELFLTQIMGFSWDQVHEIAEQIEHLQSPLFFDKMDELLGFPTEDPHGSPIPTKEGEIKKRDYISLDNCQTGDLVRFKSINYSSSKFLDFLGRKKLSLNTEILVLHSEPFDGSKTLQYNQRKPEVFSRVVCEKILVEKI